MTAIATQAIGYIRRSTNRQEESLDQQRAKLEAFAKVKGWALVHVYSDDAISGSDMDRPGLLQLVERAEKDGNVSAVIAWDRNRLARPKDAVDGLMLERRLMKAGKRVVYAATNRETDRTFAGGLLDYVEHHQNGDYLRKLSRDTARGVLSRVQRGRWPGGPIPFGYDRLFVDHAGTPRKVVRLTDDGGLHVLEAATGQRIEAIAPGQTYKKQDHEEVTLIPSEPERVRAVRKMFADYANGVPARRIRDGLNAAGFRTTYGRTFCISSINAILENETYTGRCVYNKRTESKWHRLINGSSVERADEGWERRPEADWVITENAWEAIIDRPTFERVQERREASRESHPRVSGHALRAEYLLTGLGVCGVCGSKLTGCTTTSGKGIRTRYCVCSAHHRGDHAACPVRYSVPAESVEQHIIGLIRSDLERLRDDDKLHAQVADEYRRMTGNQTDARQQLQRRLAELDQQAAKLREHFKTMDAKTAQAMGIYDEAKTVADEKEATEKRLADLGPSGIVMPDLDAIRAGIAQAFDRLGEVFAGGTIEERRELVGAYVESIKADPNRQTVKIGLYPALFSRGIGVAGFEPTTS